MFSKTALPGALAVIAVTCLIAVTFAAEGWMGASQREMFMTGEAVRFSYITKGISSGGDLVTSRAEGFTFSLSSSLPANAFIHAFEQADQPDTFFIDSMVVYYPSSNALFRFTSNPDRFPYGLINSARGIAGHTHFTGYIPVSGEIGVAFANYSGDLFSGPFTDVPPDWYDIDISGEGTFLYLSGSSELSARKRNSLDAAGFEQFDDFNAKTKIFIDDARYVTRAEVFSNASTPQPLGIYSIYWDRSAPAAAKAVITNVEFHNFTTLYSAP